MVEASMPVLRLRWFGTAPPEYGQVVAGNTYEENGMGAFDAPRGVPRFCEHPMWPDTRQNEI